jgi:uncharacterized protein (TIGR02118 family)
MYKVVVLYSPPKSPDHFRRYYAETHLPLVAKLPGLRGSRHSFVINGGESPYFCIWEGDYDNADALQEAMQSPEGKAVVADVENYATGGAVFLAYEPVEASK